MSLLIRDGETSEGDIDDARHLVRLGRRHAVAKRGEEDVALLSGEIAGVNVVENLQKIPVLLRAAQREVATSARAEMGEGDAPLAVRAVIIESGGQRAKFGFPTAHGIVVAVPWRAAVASELRLERRGVIHALGRRCRHRDCAKRESRRGKSGGVITLGTRAGERAGRLGFKGGRRPSRRGRAFTGCRGISESACVTREKTTYVHRAARRDVSQRGSETRTLSTAIAERGLV